MDELFKLLLSRCDDAGFTHADQGEAEKWAIERGLSLSNFLDTIAVEIARRYQAEHLSYEFCDSLVNDFWGDLLDYHVKNSANL